MCKDSYGNNYKVAKIEADKVDEHSMQTSELWKEE